MKEGVSVIIAQRRLLTVLTEYQSVKSSDLLLGRHATVCYVIQCTESLKLSWYNVGNVSISWVIFLRLLRMAYPISYNIVLLTVQLQVVF